MKNKNVAMMIGMIAVLLIVVGGIAPAFASSGEDMEDRVNAAKEGYGLMLGRYRAAVHDYTYAQKDFFAFRSEYLKTKRLGGGNVTEADLLARARTYLNESADYLLMLIENTKSDVLIITTFNGTVPANSTLQALQTKWLAELDADKANVTAVKAQIESATTKQQLVDAAQRMQKVWKDVREDARRVLELAKIERDVAIQRRIHLAIDKMENISARLRRGGANTSDIDERLANATSRLEDARERYEEMRERQHSLGNGTFREDVKEAKDNIKDANEIMRRAFTDLVKAERGGRGER
jgi:hypothetical protein